MNFLKSLWRKLFPVHDKEGESLLEAYQAPRFMTVRPAYDPSEDEHRIMSGEVESYFDS